MDVKHSSTPFVNKIFFNIMLIHIFGILSKNSEKVNGNILLLLLLLLINILQIVEEQKFE